MPRGVYKRTKEMRTGKSPNSLNELKPFKKGNAPWSQGKEYTEEYKKNMSLATKGKNTWMKGTHPSEITKLKMSLTQKRIGNKPPIMTGEKHWNWQGGISNNPYPEEFNTELKLKIRTRDNFTCCLCGRTEREELDELNRVLSVNHIDFDKNNCKKNNLNTLCVRCNVKINRDREYWTNYFMIR